MRNLFAIAMFLPVAATAQNTGIGTNAPHPSALLDITSNNKGLLVPRMTTAVRNNILLPAKGLLVFDSSLGTFVFHDGLVWAELLNDQTAFWKPANSKDIYAQAQNVGIGTTAPAFSLHVVNTNSQDGGWAQGIMIENPLPDPNTGEAAISFRNTAFSANKQWNIGLNQSSPLAFNFGTSFAGGNTRMVIDTIGRVGVGTTAPDSSALLHMNSTSKGLIVSRMTSAQRKAIDGPALGLLVYDTDKRTIYMFDGASWLPFASQAEGFLPLSSRTVDTIPQDFLDIGNATAIDGEFAATSSTSYDQGGIINSGCVFIFKKNGGRWDYIQQVLPDVPQADARFGSEVAVNGNFLAVSSPYWNAGAVADRGKIWYYKWDGAGSFQLLDTLSISTGLPQDNFGFSLAARGNSLLVGSPGETISGVDNAGAIYVYTFNAATNKYENRTKLTAPNRKSGDKLGYAVDVDGAYIVAGAPFHPFGTGDNKGIAHIWTGSVSSWGYQDSCTYASSSTPFERLGLYVSINGVNVACGANYRLSDSYNPGTAVMFRRSGSVWNKVQEIQSDDNDNLSTIPQVNVKGTSLVIGNSAEDNFPGNKGNVYVYKLENLVWVLKRRIYDYLVPGNFQFPSSLSQDGANIIIGNYPYNNRQGQVYFTTVEQ